MNVDVTLGTRLVRVRTWNREMMHCRRRGRTIRRALIGCWATSLSCEQSADNSSIDCPENLRSPLVDTTSAGFS